MPYLINKPCKFSGENHAIGDVIPDELVDSTQIRRLIATGYITEVPANKMDTSNLTEQPKPDDPEQPEPSDLEPSESKQPEIDLTKLKKDELIEVAISKGIQTDDSMTKNAIIELIENAEKAEGEE